MVPPVMGALNILALKITPLVSIHCRPAVSHGIHRTDGAPDGRRRKIQFRFLHGAVRLHNIYDHDRQISPDKNANFHSLSIYTRI